MHSITGKSCCGNKAPLTHAVIISSLWLTSCLKGGDGWLPRVLLCVCKGTIDCCCRWFQPPFVDLPMKAQLHGS